MHRNCNNVSVSVGECQFYFFSKKNQYEQIVKSHEKILGMPIYTMVNAGWLINAFRDKNIIY